MSGYHRVLVSCTYC